MSTIPFSAVIWSTKLYMVLF